MSKIRVFVVEDREFVRASLPILIDDDPRMICVGQHARNDDKVIAAMRRARTSLALIDLVLETYGNPDSISRQTSGFELIKRVRTELPDVRILAMSHFGNVEELSLDAGAHGFVHKDKFAPMRKAIIRVARRQRPAERARPSTPCLTVFVRTHQIQLPADKEEHPIRTLEPVLFTLVLYLARARQGKIEPAFVQIERAKGVAEYRPANQDTWRQACEDAGGHVHAERSLSKEKLTQQVAKVAAVVRDFWKWPLLTNYGPKKGVLDYQIARELEVQVEMTREP